jgi:hypothetical protein
LLNLDPSSPVSAAKREMYNQQTGKIAPESMAGADIDESMKMISPGIHNIGLIGVQEKKGQTAQDIQGQKGDTSLKAAQIAADARVKASQQGLGLREDSLNERVHNQQLKTINNDQTLNQLQTSHNNLANAIQLFQQGGATPQEFHELQQAVRGNLGMKGGSGVGERESTYLKSLGISADSVKQFLTGNPQSVIESDPKFAEQIVNLAKMEMKNKETMAGAQLDRLKNGRSSFYQKIGNEGRSQDMENTINARKAQFGLIDPNAQNAAAPQSPSGGLLGGQPKQGPKQSKPKTVTQNGHTYQLNEVTGEYE